MPHESYQPVTWYDRHVFPLGQVIDDARAVILPEVVVVAVAHRFDQPGLVIGRELERRRTGLERQRADVVLHVQSHLGQRRGHRRIADRARRGRGGGGRPGGVAEREDPVEPAQLERAVVAHAVAPEVRHRIDRDHRLELRRMADGERMLHGAAVGGADGAQGPVRPRLRGDPLRRVEAVVPVVLDRRPVPFGEVSPADVLRDRDVTVPREEAGRPRGSGLAVRRAFHDRRQPGGRGAGGGARQVDVGRQADAVAHRHHHVAEDGDPLGRLGLQMRRNERGDQDRGERSGAKAHPTCPCPRRAPDSAR